MILILFRLFCQTGCALKKQKKERVANQGYSLFLFIALKSYSITLK